MRISTCATLTRVLVALGAVLTATSVYGQAQNAGRNLNIFAVNLDNKNVYSVNFPFPPTGGGSTTIDNKDQNNFVRPESLAFVVNASTNELDLLIADNQRGTIYRYPGAFANVTQPGGGAPAPVRTATLVWDSVAQNNGPTSPDAMAVDGYGNLFVANSTSGHSQNGQLWEFPVGPATQGGQPVSGYFGTPIPLDKNFGSKEALLEVVLVPTDIAGATGVSGGDLVLLTTQNVFVYSQSSGYKNRTTLLTFPNGSPVPGGIDFWPFGNGSGANYSVLVSSNGSGVINRYYFTNPLTPAAAPFATGLGAVYKIKTLFQQGKPLLFVSQTGAILEFAADANGNGTLQAQVTQNVTVPQGLAVSNAFTSAASVCVTQPGGCNLTGLVTHAPTGVTTLSGNFVESVCTVNQDPRVSITGGVWACSAQSLLVNAICPGFDNTGKLVIPDTLCGRSGSSKAGFSLIKTLIDDTQFFVPSGSQNRGGYVQHELVNADGTSPICGTGAAGDGLPGAAADGAVIWGPLLAEGTNVESPNMRDISSGCGSGKGGTSGFSVFGEGFYVNEAAPELNPPNGLLHPLENLAQRSYNDLTNTIDSLTKSDPNNPKHTRWTDNNPNIAQSVSLELWGGNVPPANGVDPFGCLDQSWLDFYNATQVDTDGSPQWTADLQNAANLLTNADASTNTTCAGIIDYAQLNTPSAFLQTPQSPNALSVLNPYGQLVSQVANLYYTVNTRLLGNPNSAAWPLPVSVNVLPNSVTLTPNGPSGNATLSWNAPGAPADNVCSLTSSDGQYTNVPLTTAQQALVIPASDANSIVKYTVSCTDVPPASSVSAYVTVYQPPTISVSNTPVLVGTPVTLSWNTYNNQGCTASSTGTDTNPADAFTGKKSGPGSMIVTPNAAGTDTYTLACTTPPNTSVSTQPPLTVLAAPTLTFNGGPTVTTALQGSVTTLYWNTNGNSNCTLTGTDGLSVQLSANPATGSTNVNPNSAGTYTYTLACTGPPATSPQQITLTVVQQPTVSVSPSPITQGSSSTLTWTGSTSACSWSSTDPGFNAPAVSDASDSTPVKPSSAGSFTYTLTCPSPTQPATASLTVNAPQPPAISVSPSSITLGSSSTLAWTINTGDVCTASSSGTDTNPNDAFTLMKSSPIVVTPNATGTDTYTLNCTVPATTQSATLTVNPSPANIAITITPIYDLDIGDPGLLSWTLSGGTTGCVVSGSWPKFSVPQFSPFPVAKSGSKQVTWKTAGVYTYTLSCTNPSSPVQTSVTITNDK
jgi:hypothetical protein